MLDENLPTFVNKPSSETPNIHILYFTQNGDEPSPEYILKRPDPSLPASRNKHAVGLVDSSAQDVVYAEVLIEPEWTQPSLSAAELRAQSAAASPPEPVLPEGFTIQLYNPDQQVVVKQIPGTWNSRESWEFEMPEQSFRMPSASKIDREQDDPVASELTPKIIFRWKREGRLSKDMTCYMMGKSLGGRKSKDPDITVAMFKQRRGGETAVTVYEPNMQRVEVEDRKGLDIVLLLGADVIKHLYISPGPDPFNVASGPTTTGAPARRKNSRPSVGGGTAPVGFGAGAVTMSGALNNAPPTSSSKPTTSMSNIPSSSLSSSPPGGGAALPASSSSLLASSSNAIPAVATTNPRTQWEIDAETKRLTALVEKEERERERRDKMEQKRIKNMLEEEAKERRKRDAVVTKETERLKKLYGVEGQTYHDETTPTTTAAAAARPNMSNNGPAPQLPPRRTAPMMSGGGVGGLMPSGQPWMTEGSIHQHPPAPPPRPVSAGPPSTSTGGGHFNFPNCNILGAIAGYGRGMGHHHGGSGGGGGSGSYMQLQGGGMSAKDKKKMQKKRSVHF